MGNLDNFSLELKELYETSFPLHERRSWAAQVVLYNSGQLRLHIIESENQFAGFVFYWQLSGFIFIEHFATRQEWRGKGMGTFVMSWLIEKFSTIVLEAEPPEVSAEATRRVQFYERLGFTRFADAYAQPPYHNGDEYTPMLLMYVNLDVTKHSFEKIKTEVYRTVYGLLS